MTMDQQVPVLSFQTNNKFPDLALNKQNNMSPPNHAKKTIIIRESQIKRVVGKHNSFMANNAIFRT